MPELFFSKFPVITYANTQCIDITKRVIVDAGLRRNPIVYDQHELKHATRADIIAENYYGDPSMDWMLFLVNGIIDPYYGWNLSSFDFDEHLIKKYGSIELSTQKTAYYKINTEDDTEFSVDYYDSYIPENLKKYYSPNFNENLDISSYSRRKDNVIVNTNKVYQFEVSLANSTSGFTIGELVTASPGAANGEVVFANSTFVKVKNVTGNFNASITTVKGRYSTANATVVSKTLLNTNIPDDEAIYWTSVSYYDYENDINEKHKSIKLMNPAYASETAFNMRKTLKL